ncbi:MAG: NifU family protein [Erysipelotrichaceae bacterium]
MMTKEEEIISVIEKIRPYMQRDGGDVAFVKFEDGIVYVNMMGACSECYALDDTLKLGVEAILLEEVEGVLEVRLAN